MLEKINQIFGDIKDAIVQQGVEVGDCDSPDTYADRILQIDVCNNAEDCEEGGEGGGGSSSSKGYVYFFFPAFRASEKQPDTPSGSIRSLFTVTSGNYVQTLNYPSGWASATVAIANEVAKYDMTANPTLNPMWMSYCIVAIRNDSPSYYMDWTTPLCLGYPYANPTSDEWVGNGGNGGNGGSDNNYYNGSRTFLIYAELGSTGYTLSTPVGGTWDTETNQLVGDVTSNSSNGQVRWSVNNNHTPGMYTYISIGTFGYDGNIIGTWSDPFCINASNGKDGRNGVDGVNVQFIYKRCADLTDFNSLPTPTSNRYTDEIPTGWTAVPTGIDCTAYKVEACSTRKLESNGSWSVWSKPVIWAMCGGDGSGDGSGSGDGGGSGGGSGSGIVTNVEPWFKLSNYRTGIVAPVLSVIDPTTEGWSKTQSTPNANYPYLWCFFQTNYTSTSYTRSAAYIIRTYDQEIGDAFRDMNTVLNNVKSELEANVNSYQDDLLKISNSLNDLRSEIQNEILKTNLEKTNVRIENIEETGVSDISGPALWGKMTSYKSDANATNAQRSFADFLLNAEDASLTLDTGSAFFDKKVTAGLTLNGLDGRIEEKATKTYVDGLVAGATFSVTPELIQAIVSKGQAAWLIESTGELKDYSYGYADFIANYEGQNETILTDYENYMSHKGSYTSTGHPEGPFKLVTIVNEFSEIKQTSNEISSSVTAYLYVWEHNNTGEIVGYEDLRDNWTNRESRYSSLDYEPYCASVLHYTKKETSEVLSKITQTNSEIKSEVGNINKVWRKTIEYDDNTEGYEYEQYACPSNKTPDTYESEMTNARWELYKWAPKLSVIDQTADAITLAMSNSAVYWALTNDEENKNTWKPYNEWYEQWLEAKVENADDVHYTAWFSTYEKYVAHTQPNYKLIKVNEKASQIKQTVDGIEADVSDINGNISTIQQTVNNISLIVGGDTKLWYCTNEFTYDNQRYYPGFYVYDTWRSYYEATTSSPTDAGYESWVLANVATHGDLQLKQNERKIGAIQIGNDDILMGIGYGNGQYLSAIHLTPDEDNPNLGRIVLDAANTEVKGTLSAAIIDAQEARIREIAANSVLANRLESIDEDFTKRILIEDGKAEFYLWDDAMNNTDGGWRKRIEIGVEGSNNNDLVLKFFDENGTELYNLGPAGLTDILGGIVKDSDGIIIDSDGNWF